MAVFGGVVGGGVPAVEAADDDGDFGAQIDHFLQNAGNAAVLFESSLHFGNGMHADLAFAVIAQRGGFQDAGQVLRGAFVDVTAALDGLIGCGGQAGFAYPCFFGNAVLGDGNAVAAGGNACVLRQIAHGLCVDVFKFGGDGGALCQRFQGGGIVKRDAEVAIGKACGGGVRVGVEHGYAVAHGFGGHGEHAAQLSAAQNAEHGGREDGFHDTDGMSGTKTLF